ncbi:hypothetical protein IMG5_167580, partial [Ichthyophthirius multifiliis]
IIKIIQKKKKNKIKILFKMSFFNDFFFNDFFRHGFFDDQYRNIAHHYHSINRPKYLENRLKQYNNYEQRLQRQIQQTEEHISSLKQQMEDIAKDKESLINQIEQEKHNPQCQKNSQQQPGQQQYNQQVYRKHYYKTPEMEIEEQYDSTNPQNCYKYIKKQGEQPQLISGDAERIEHEKLGEGLDEKLDQLIRITGKNTKELVDLVKNKKELTVGQLYDQAVELKIV